MVLAGVEPCVLVPRSIREWFRCQVLRPLLRALRGGVTPRRLAWSLALGMVVGINPSVGLTTLFVVLVAWVFGLSKLASLVGTHMVAPLHLLLFIPFIELGVHLFHTRKLPMDRKQLEHLSPSPASTLSRHLAMGVARADRLGRGGWDCDASARCVPAPRTGCAAAKTQNAGALTACGALSIAFHEDYVREADFSYRSDRKNGDHRPRIVAY
jgi:hypothetical protein